MANAPTRPPTYRHGRRLPKGPRLVAGSIHDRLNAAAARLSQVGDHDSAEAVRAVAAPGGWNLLRAAQGSGREVTNLTLSTNTTIKSALNAAAEEFGVVLSHLATEGFEQVRDGLWIPAKVGRSQGGARTVVNVTIDDAVRREVRAMLPRLSQEAGYRITEGSIALSWLCEELGVDRGTGAMFPLVLPKPLRDHFMAAVESGVSLEEVVQGRVAELESGAWVMPRPVRRPKGTQADVEVAKMPLRLDDRVRDALEELAPRLAAEFGVQVFPGTVVRAILTDRLGEPPAV